MRREPPPPAPDRLERVRNAVRGLRDAELELSRLEGLVATQKEVIWRTTREELPDLFSEVQCREFTLEPEGNLPAYSAKASAYYHANIAADWDDARRELAFEALAGAGGADLVKYEVTVLLPRDSVEKSELVKQALQRLGVDFKIKLAVPWNSLTAFVREAYEKRKVTLPLEALGAEVGRIVKLKKET